ncbi:hypothetical protein ACX0G7_26915 [Flavitalea antarctica]
MIVYLERFDARQVFQGLTAGIFATEDKMLVVFKCTQAPFFAVSVQW